jgi:hypothetical protein
MDAQPNQQCGSCCQIFPRSDPNEQLIYKEHENYLKCSLLHMASREGYTKLVKLIEIASL